MCKWILIFLGLLAPDTTGSVAVEAALALHGYKSPVSACKCGGKCVNGVITQGDGHKTPCPCPPDCPCKVKK